MKVYSWLQWSLLITLPNVVTAQDSLVERVESLEARNLHLVQALDSLSLELERLQLNAPSPVSAAGEGQTHGVTLGGYGEAVFTDASGSGNRTTDFLRNVLYAGYQFDDVWRFNSEIEFEHASTDKAGSASVEFAYLEYQRSEALAFRAGLLLAPIGFINEMHEPTTYLGASRPVTESRIIPTTWRENGVGILGQTDEFQYRLSLLTGLDATGFDESGLRGGRQKGSKSKAEDLALAARLDWVGHPGLLAGVSVYAGQSDQGQAGLGSVDTHLVDLHAQYEWNAWRFRGLLTSAHVGNTEELFVASGADATVVGKRQDGYYLEAGYDLFHHSDGAGSRSLRAFVRFEELDTHASVSSALTEDPNQRETIQTIGLQWSPVENVVFKIDYQDFDRAADQVHVSLGYAF
ncbi:MAG: hypothetical protein KDB61_04815 [Planctomycetes bacterium]|nr:hypothetical protein [Planctomycetota bacterium]